MTLITEQQRSVLVEHALYCNWPDRPGEEPAEAEFAEVIADLAMDRPVADRQLLTRFLWRRVSRALEAGLSRKDHWVWSAAVQVLDQLGEDLGDIFTGRDPERLAKAPRAR